MLECQMLGLKSTTMSEGERGERERECVCLRKRERKRTEFLTWLQVAAEKLAIK